MDCGNELMPTVYVICFSHLVILVTTVLKEEKFYQKVSLLKLHGPLRSTIHLAQLFEDEYCFKGRLMYIIGN